MRPAAIWQFCDLPPHYMREVLDGIHRYVNTLRGELIWERILKHTSHCLLGLCWLWNLVLTWNACVGNKITIMVFTCSDWANIALSTCICTFLWPGVEKITLLLFSTATYKIQFRGTEDLCLFYAPIPCNFVYKNCAKGIDWSMCEGTLGPTVRLQGVIQPTPVPNLTVICIVQQNWYHSYTTDNRTKLCFWNRVKWQPEIFFLFTIATIIIKTAAILKCDISSI